MNLSISSKISNLLVGFCAWFKFHKFADTLKERGMPRRVAMAIGDGEVINIEESFRLLQEAANEGVIAA